MLQDVLAKMYGPPLPQSHNQGWHETTPTEVCHESAYSLSYSRASRDHLWRHQSRGCYSIACSHRWPARRVASSIQAVRWGRACGGSIRHVARAVAHVRGRLAHQPHPCRRRGVCHRAEQLATPIYGRVKPLANGSAFISLNKARLAVSADKVSVSPLYPGCRQP